MKFMRLLLWDHYLAFKFSVTIVNCILYNYIINNDVFWNYQEQKRIQVYVRISMVSLRSTGLSSLLGWCLYWVCTQQVQGHWFVGTGSGGRKKLGTQDGRECPRCRPRTQVSGRESVWRCIHLYSRQAV